MIRAFWKKMKFPVKILENIKIVEGERISDLYTLSHHYAYPSGTFLFIS